MPNNPIVIDPPNFDAQAEWAKYREANDNVINEDGTVNWKAAHCADPGVCSCPMCGEHYWNLGIRQQCIKCGFQYPTNWWPMYSWGCQDKLRNRFPDRDHWKSPYYQYGYNNPVEDAIEERNKIDWRIHGQT